MASVPNRDSGSLSWFRRHGDRTWKLRQSSSIETRAAPKQTGRQRVKVMWTLMYLLESLEVDECGWPNVVQEKETVNAKKKKSSSKKQRHLSGDKNNDLDMCLSGAEHQTPPRDPVSSDRLDNSIGNADRHLLGPLPSLSPQISSRGARHSDQPAESYRRLPENEDDSRQLDGSAFPGPAAGAGKLMPLGQLEPLNAPGLYNENCFTMLYMCVK